MMTQSIASFYFPADCRGIVVQHVYIISSNRLEAILASAEQGSSLNHDGGKLITVARQLGTLTVIYCRHLPDTKKRLKD